MDSLWKSGLACMRMQVQVQVQLQIQTRLAAVWPLFQHLQPLQALQLLKIPVCLPTAQP